MGSNENIFVFALLTIVALAITYSHINTPGALMQDLQTYIKAQDGRAIIVDREDDGLSVSVHTQGGHTLCTLDRNQAIELLHSIQLILGAIHG